MNDNEMADSNTLVQICIYILTWNVCGRYPSICLDDALSINRTACPNEQHKPDIYVISFQNVIRQNKSSKNPDRWMSKIQENLDDKGYKIVGSEYMRDLVISVWSQPEHLDYLKYREGAHTKTGVGWSKKGSVSIRFDLYGVGVVFVGCQFTAIEEDFLQSVKDFDESVYSQKFKTQKYRNVFDHDLVFCFGDLNFRLDSEDSAIYIKSAVNKGNLRELYEIDQLKWAREMATKLALLKEEMPEFPPTCKFVEGTSEYDLTQRPAWCDRILYYVQDIKDRKNSNIEIDLKQITYKSHPDYSLSNNKPVSAEFHLTIASDASNEDDVDELIRSSHLILRSIRSCCGLFKRILQLFWKRSREKSI